MTFKEARQPDVLMGRKRAIGPESGAIGLSQRHLGAKSEAFTMHVYGVRIW